MITLRALRLLFFTALPCGIAISCLAQTKQETSLGALLEGLHSPSGPVRSEAFEQLRSTPANLQNPTVQKALLNLLDRENHDLDQQLVTAEAKHLGTSEDDSPQLENSDEGFGIYYSELIDAVDSFANWNDPKQACILVNSSSSDDSAFAAEIADHARVTIPCLLQRAKTTIAMNRAVTVPILVRALAKGGNSVDSESAATAKAVVLKALQDPDEGVRTFTINSLGRFGSKEMIPALQRVAENDPAPDAQGHSVRKEAAQAIVEIQKRTVPK